MSLTNIVYTPVDTGRANVSKEWDNANLKDFYLLTGKVNWVGPPLRRSKVNWFRQKLMIGFDLNGRSRICINSGSVSEKIGIQ